ncbi:MAG: phosphonate C-P lyase system protein PhnG [Burkholderiales bacterium]
MLQASDTASPDTQQSHRAAWMALLARSPLDLLESNAAFAARFDEHVLRHPETGLMMVQGRVGGSGARFNLGEVTVTRCAVRLEATDATDATESVGVSYVLGRSRRKAHLAALCDAMLQIPNLYPILETSLLNPIRQYLAEAADTRTARAASTKVDFFTVAREAGPTGAAGGLA